MKYMREKESQLRKEVEIHSQHHALGKRNLQSQEARERASDLDRELRQAKSAIEDKERSSSYDTQKRESDFK